MFNYIVKHAPAIYIGLLFVGVIYSVINVETQDGLGNSINSQLSYEGPKTIK